MRCLTIFSYKQRARVLLNELKENPSIEIIDTKEDFPETKIFISPKKIKKEDFLNYLTTLKHQYKDVLLSLSGMSLFEEVAHLLIKNRLTISVAESCTGGLISHLLTQVSGSSSYFMLGTVTYSNDAKIKILNVPPEIIKKYGAVHIKTAEYMAKGVRAILNTDFGLATTGIAGPTGGSKKKPVGTICVSVCSNSTHMEMQYTKDFGEREKNKFYFAYLALNLLRQTLLDMLENLYYDRNNSF